MLDVEKIRKDITEQGDNTTEDSEFSFIAPCAPEVRKREFGIIRDKGHLCSADGLDLTVPDLYVL